MRPITAIVIHCAYTPVEMDIGVAEIDRWHRDRGFNSCGYHYVIRRDGTIEVGRHEDVAGAHVAGHNTSTIGVCLVGGKRDDGDDCNFSRHQWRSLESLVTTLKGRYPGAEVKGHRDFAARACPTFDAAAWWAA